MSLPVIEPVRLEGDRVVLEPIRPDHREGLWEAAQAPEIWKWLVHLTDSRELFDSWVDEGIDSWVEGDRKCFVTCSRKSGQILGSTSFLSYRPADDVVEIGYTWLNPAAWGTGANVEAKLLMIGHAFAVLGCARVEFKTDARNERSRAALAAIPAQFEGVLRNHMMVFGVGRRDSAYFSVIDSEWPEVRRNLETRLAGGG
ncbi:MAG: GNAT family N-acetyltransferase [Solirubrobacterales bacterium]|nr:GNAT family N-acetyltransferase [Solirubrobacterales bacterium]